MRNVAKPSFARSSYYFLSISTQIHSLVSGFNCLECFELPYSTCLHLSEMTIIPIGELIGARLSKHNYNAFHMPYSSAALTQHTFCWPHHSLHYVTLQNKEPAWLPKIYFISSAYAIQALFFTQCHALIYVVYQRITVAFFLFFHQTSQTIDFCTALCYAFITLPVFAHPLDFNTFKSSYVNLWHLIASFPQHVSHKN